MKKLIIALLITLCPFTAWAGCPVNELIYNTLTPITFSFEKRNGTGEDTANTANKKLSLSYWNGSAWRWVGSDNLWDDTTETQLAMIQITGSQYYFNIPAAALSSTVSGQYIAIRFDEADDVDVTMSCVAYVQPQDRIIDTDNVGINWGDVSNPTTTVGLTNTTIPWNPAWDVEVESESTDALVAINLDHLISKTTEASGQTSTTTSLYMTTGSAVDDTYNGMSAAWMTGAGVIYTSIVSDYVGTTKLLTVNPPFPATPT